MSVKIRLSRKGHTNRAFYRVVAQDGRTATSSRFLENLGWYDPRQEGVNYKLKLDRIDYWIDNGAQMSDTAKSLIKKARLTQGSEEEAPVMMPDPVEAPAEEEAAAEPEAEAAAEEAPAEEAVEEAEKAPEEAEKSESEEATS